MEIRKRNGESVPFQQEKIFNAMKKAFDGQGKEIGSRELDEILATVLDNLSVTVPLTVERVQDEVERTLMERGHYEVPRRTSSTAKSGLRCAVSGIPSLGRWGMTRLTRCFAASRWILPRKSTPSRRFK